MTGLRDADPRIRRLAARVLEAAQGNQVVGALAKTVHDKDASVRAAALRSLGVLLAAISPDDWDADVVTAVVSAAADPDPGVRIAAVRALRGATLDAAIDALVSALADTEGAIRSEAASALRGRCTAHVSEQLLIASYDDLPEVRAAAL